jgi:UDP-N-acetylglucosamine 2-epimerase (non-hydrolysing)
MTTELKNLKMSVEHPEIVTIAGTRPEIIKLAEFAKLIKGRNHALWYTGQHFSENMKDIFFDELGISADLDLKSGTSDVNVLKGNIVQYLRTAKPKWVIVYGDTYSTMAGTLAARELGCKLIHLEAGIRDLDSMVPEEGVRIYIDSVADYHLAPTELAKTFLSYEGVEKNVHVTGNLIVDVCKKLANLADNKKRTDLPEKYLLLTMHRPENVDDPEKLALLVKHISSLEYKVVFPIHPRTRKNLAKYGIALPSNVIALDPVGYMEFLGLLKNCELVMTDSGGVTEEAVILKKPCITLRHTTARWETILLKANILFPLDRKDPLSDTIGMMLQTKITKNPYGENVAEKTIRMIDEITS